MKKTILIILITILVIIIFVGSEKGDLTKESGGDSNVEITCKGDKYHYDELGRIVDEENNMVDGKALSEKCPPQPFVPESGPLKGREIEYYMSNGRKNNFYGFANVPLDGEKYLINDYDNGVYLMARWSGEKNHIIKTPIDERECNGLSSSECAEKYPAVDGEGYYGIQLGLYNYNEGEKTLFEIDDKKVNLEMEKLAEFISENKKLPNKNQMNFEVVDC